jgi:hypothetical protein
MILTALAGTTQALAATTDPIERLGVALFPVAAFFLVILILLAALFVTGRDTTHRYRASRERASDRHERWLSETEDRALIRIR